MESDPVLLKKVILNKFGIYRETEISLDTPFTVVGGEEETAGKTVIDAIVGVLFGCPPGRRGEFSRYAPSSAGEPFSASLFLTTEDGQEYLVGKDFHREELEVFQKEDFSLALLSPTSLMDILHGELKTLNPIDFEALFVFHRGPVAIRLDAPVLREQLNKIWSHGLDRRAVEGILPASPAAAAATKTGTEIDTAEYLPPGTSAGDSGEAGTAGITGTTRVEEPEEVKAALSALEKIKTRRRELEEKLEELTRQDARHHELEEQLARVKEEREELAAYEPFVASGSQLTVEELSRQLTSVELERKYLEEKIREKRDRDEGMRREISLLREKIAAFPQEFMDPALENEVKVLVRQKEEKIQLLRKLEEQLKLFTPKKGLLGLRGRRPETIELEEKIAQQLDEISAIRNRLNTLLKGKPAEDFLQEVELQRKYLADLVKLEKMPVTAGEEDYSHYEEQHRELLRQEEEIRGKLRELLAQAGAEEYGEIKEKVKRLSFLIRLKKELEDEIAVLATEASPERRSALEAEKKRLEEEERQQEEAIELGRRKAVKEREAREKAEASPEEIEKAQVRADYLLEAGEKAAVDEALAVSYLRLAKLVDILTVGEYNGVLPEFREGEIDLLVREKATATWISQQLLPPVTADLIRLAFRVFLARLHTPAREFPLLFDGHFLGRREEGERVLALLGETYPEAQIITFLPETA
jgi:hypothetical protein